MKSPSLSLSLALSLSLSLSLSPLRNRATELVFQVYVYQKRRRRQRGKGAGDLNCGHIISGNVGLAKISSPKTLRPQTKGVDCKFNSRCDDRKDENIDAQCNFAYDTLQPNYVRGVNRILAVDNTAARSRSTYDTVEYIAAFCSPCCLHTRPSQR
jgi:hypothetical protein